MAAETLLLADGDVCASRPLWEPLRAALCRGHAGAQPVVLQHPLPRSPGLRSSPPRPLRAPGSSPGSRSAAGPDSLLSVWVCTGGLTQHFWVFFPPRALRSIPGSLRVSVPHTKPGPFGRSQSLLPHRTSHNHPGVPLLKSRSSGVFPVCLWEFLFHWRFCFVAVFCLLAKQISSALFRMSQKILPHDGHGDREAKNSFFSNGRT